MLLERVRLGLGSILGAKLLDSVGQTVDMRRGPARQSVRSSVWSRRSRRGNAAATADGVINCVDRQSTEID